MRFTSETTSNGVSQRPFTVGDVPGVLWLPAASTGPFPLVLLGHGGGQHKNAPGVAVRAQRYVTRLGFAAAAIDAPGHGDRPQSAGDARFTTELRRRMAGGEPVGELIARQNGTWATQAVPEWSTVLDALQKLDEIGAGGPVAYWGVSLGSMIGLPFIAAEPRITAAVLGLVGDNEILRTAAPRVTAAVRFLLQWDDEIVPRAAGLALFDALASPAKTLSANPGGHFDLPRFEMDGDERFLQRHLVRDC